MNVTLPSLFLPLLADATQTAQAVAGTNPWQYFFGASTGASFYILMRSYGYLTNRSFDTKYNAAYITRFFCGVAAGFILAHVSGFFIAEGTPWGRVGPGIFALLGGFSAEAVEEILKRMVELLLTLVKGSGQEQAEALLKSEKAKLEADQVRKNAALVKSLSDLPLAGPPDQLQQALKTLIASL